jgi:mono/diheme cytochrome c family protein
VLRILPILVLFLLALGGCEEMPTRTVSKCFPNEGACDDFLGANARIEADPALGAETYRVHCSRCHAPDGRAMGLIDRGDFQDPGWQRRWSDSDLASVITAGRGMKMPGTRLTTLEMKSLIQHVRSLDPSRGKADEVIQPIEGQGPLPMTP